MSKELEMAMARLGVLEHWLEGFCTCPCCQQARKCSEGCTFAVDCPEDAERMEECRAVLTGGDK